MKIKIIILKRKGEKEEEVRFEKTFFTPKYEFGFVVKLETYQFHKNGNSDFQILFQLKTRERCLKTNKQTSVLHEDTQGDKNMS